MLAYLTQNYWKVKAIFAEFDLPDIKGNDLIVNVRNIERSLDAMRKLPVIL